MNPSHISCHPALFSHGRSGLLRYFRGAQDSTQGLIYHRARTWWFSRFPCPLERKKVTLKEKAPGMARLHTPIFAIPWPFPQSWESIFKIPFIRKAPHTIFLEESQQCMQTVLKTRGSAEPCQVATSATPSFLSEKIV